MLGRIVMGLPQWVWRALAWCLATLWWDVLRIRRPVVLDNLRRAFPDWSQHQVLQTAKASLVHMGWTLLEFLQFPFLEESDVSQRCRFHGLEHLQGALSGGRGVLILTAHLGNGDYAIAALSRSGVPMSLISKEFRAGWLNRLWFGLRGRHGTQFIPVEKSSFEILRALRRNRCVVFVLDQFMGPPSGVLTTFFGHPTGTAQGLAIFALKTGVPVVPSFTYRDPQGVHHLEFEKPLPPATGSVESLTQMYTDVIEAAVRRHPEQWMWIHRRWKNFG